MIHARTATIMSGSPIVAAFLLNFSHSCPHPRPAWRYAHAVQRMTQCAHNLNARAVDDCRQIHNQVLNKNSPWRAGAHLNLWSAGAHLNLWRAGARLLYENVWRAEAHLLKQNSCGEQKPAYFTKICVASRSTYFSLYVWRPKYV